MAEKKMMDYDAENDSFFIYKKGEKVKGSIDLEDFVIDFDHSGNVVGLEILNASKVMANLGVTKAMLTSAISAGFVSNRKGDALYIYFGIVLANKVEKQSMVAIPAVTRR